jgi:sortase A
MSKILSCICAVAVLFALPIPLHKEIMMPVPVAEASDFSLMPAAPNALPTGIAIPSIKLNTGIEYMGLNEKGELDVPSGQSKNVGWYKYGTIPGHVGSAVMDAHVYAAFKNLKNVRVGDDVYVAMQNGTTLHFKITEKKVVPLSEVPIYEFFHRAEGRELHIITCAGTFSKKLDTYDKRLLVYATLVE